MFQRTRAPGAWVNLSAATPSEMEDLDAKTSKAIDGDAGGSYAPSALITIGGSGLTVNGAFTSMGTPASFQAGALFNAPGIIMGDSQLAIGFAQPGLLINSGNLTLGSGSASIGGTLTVTGDAQFNANIVSTGVFNGKLGGFNNLSCVADPVSGLLGSGHFDGPLSTNSTFSAIGTTTFYGQVNIEPNGFSTLLCDAPVVIKDMLTLSVHGRINYRVARTALNGQSANQLETYGVKDCDIVMVGGSGALSGTNVITWKITSDSAIDGSRMTVSRELDQGSCWVYVVRDDNSLIVNLDNTNANSSDLVFSNGRWERVRTSKSAF